MALVGGEVPAPERAGTILPLGVRGLVFESDTGRRLIDGVDLDLAAGSRTVILGPNGAGKSLLMRLLHGLLSPTAGSIRWHGQRPEGAVRDRQAMVFQRPVLLRRSVAANVRYALAARRIPRAERAERVQEALHAANLGHLEKTPARLLSGGEQQRLALARALSTSPEVLLLDEPTASLDPASTQLIEHLLDDAHAAGMKIVLVTHDLHQARRLADEVVFMRAGRVEEHAPADAFFDSPRSDAARAYLDGRIVF